MEQLALSNGGSADWETAHREGLRHKTVQVWAYNKDGNVLLQQRGHSVTFNPGQWDASVAGHVRFGETPVAAAIREIDEEMGIKIDAFALTHFETFTRDKNRDKYIDSEEIYVYYFYYDGKIPQPTQDVAGFKWSELNTSHVYAQRLAQAIKERIKKQLTILSLNIWNYSDFEKRKPLIEAFIEKTDADIVVLQEVRDDESKHKKNQLEQLKHIYPFTQFYPILDNQKRKQLTYKCWEGTAILAKQPIETVTNTQIGINIPDPYQRRFILLKIANCLIAPIHLSPADELAHAQLAYIEAQSQTKDAILVGDYNCKYPEIVHKILKNHVTSTQIINYESYPQKKETLDYISLPKNCAFDTFECVNVTLSDHQPLLARIFVKNKF